MNINIATVGSRGDVQPYVALGQGLQGVGHRVQIVTDRVFEDFIRRAGLGFIPVKVDPHKALQAVCSFKKYTI